MKHAENTTLCTNPNPNPSAEIVYPPLTMTRRHATRKTPAMKCHRRQLFPPGCSPPAPTAPVARTCERLPAITSSEVATVGEPNV